MVSSEGDDANKDGIKLDIGNGDALLDADVEVEERRKEEVATDTLFTRLGTIIFSFSFLVLSVSRSLASERLARRLTALLYDSKHFVLLELYTYTYTYTYKYTSIDGYCTIGMTSQTNSTCISKY